MALEPITRAEQIMSGESLEPITREEMFLAKAAGMDVDTPEPITRREMFLSKISGGSGGDSAPVLEPLTVTENGTYTPPESVDGFSKVVANVQTGGTGEDYLAARLTNTLTEYSSDIEGNPIAAYAFFDSKNLASVSLPNVTGLGLSLFERCINLTTVHAPSVTRFLGSTFKGCTALTEVSFPNMSNLDTDAFNGCTALQKADFGRPGSIFNGDFKDCASLKILIIRSARVCSLWSTSCFNGSPFAPGGTGGTVYVPSALIEQYQQASNWSSLYAAGTCNFVAIEGSEYE